MSATGVMSAILAGAITQDDLNNHVLPAVHDNVLLPILDKDCPGRTALDAPACKCKDASGGKQVISLLDTSPADCNVTLDEIKNNGLFSSLLAPDVMLDVNGVLTPALSLGLKATAVAGAFTQPTP